MTEKGWLTREKEKALAQCVDDAFKLKGLWELADGLIARIVITVIDDEGLERLPSTPEIKKQVNILADAVIEKDLKKAEKAGAAILNLCIDIPGLQEDAEALLFESLVKLLVSAVVMRLRKEE